MSTTKENGVIAGVLAPHSPRMGLEHQAPDFVKGLIGGLREMGDQLRAARPDVLVVTSSHWVSTFNWYATLQPVHRGVCVADECPDMIPGIPYQRTGDPDLGGAIAAEGQRAEVPFHLNETEHFVWDYGSLVPVQYLDPDGGIPVVLLPTVLAASLEECALVGAAVDAAARRTGRRVALVASCSLSHELVRGPDQWPTDQRQKSDHRFIDLLCAGDVAAAHQWLPDYNREAMVEAGGRNLATMLGGLAAAGGAFQGRQFGPYGQSSGSGNANVLIQR